MKCKTVKKNSIIVITLFYIIVLCILSCKRNINIKDSDFVTQFSITPDSTLFIGKIYSYMPMSEYYNVLKYYNDKCSNKNLDNKYKWGNSGKYLYFLKFKTIENCELAYIPGIINSKSDSVDDTLKTYIMTFLLDKDKSCLNADRPSLSPSTAKNLLLQSINRQVGVQYQTVSYDVYQWQVKNQIILLLANDGISILVYRV